MLCCHSHSEVKYGPIFRGQYLEVITHGRIFLFCLLLCKENNNLLWCKENIWEHIGPGGFANCKLNYVTKENLLCRLVIEFGGRAYVLLL